ncbi:MAG: gliding motility-associated C-terminal domain-containing protein, partial [Bacteroidetes bacterium]|nr:gliding motility-associated C-terminal domain-containing protein [Bacteroidota bacterium]
VTVTDNTNCTNIDSITIKVNPSPIAEAGTNISMCNGSCVTIGGSPTAIGGTPPYTYNWSPSATLTLPTDANPQACPLATTTYFVTVTDSKGCTSVDNITITVNALPIANAGQKDTICEGNCLLIGGNPTASGGTAPYTYSWSPLATLNDSTLPNPQACPLITTDYFVTVTDSEGCTDVDSITISINHNIIAEAGINDTICSGSCTTIGGSPTGSGGTQPYTYTWSPVTGLNSSSIPNPQACPLLTTTYFVTVSDVIGCIDVDSVIITVNPSPIAEAGTNDTICKESCMNIGGIPTASGGTPPYTYCWSPSATLNDSTFTNPQACPLTTTTYFVTVTDKNGCTSSDNIKIFVDFTTVEAGQNDTICGGDCKIIGGSPTALTGVAPFTYIWSPSATLNNSTIPNPSACPLVNTTYYLTVTDRNGCSNTDSVVITVNQKPIADAGIGDTICKNNCVIIGGSPTASSGTAPYFYSWLPAAGLINTNTANPQACPVTTTKYFVTVTDSKGCSAIDSVIIKVNPIPIADAGLNNKICFGSCINIGGAPTASSGVSPYTYNWSSLPAGFSSNISNPNVCPIVFTTYTVTVSDINNCTATDNISITINSLPIVDAGINDTICYGTCKSIGGSPTASGGTGPYTYIWSPSGTLNNSTIPNPQACPLVTTTYFVTVTDFAGCSKVDSIIITVNPLLTSEAGQDSYFCRGGCITIGGAPTAIGGTSPYSYSWLPASNLDNSAIANPQACPLNTTTYFVTVTDIRGCTSKDSVTVSINFVTVDAGKNDTICSGSCLTIGGNPTASDGITPYTYNWSPVDGITDTTNIANPLACPETTTSYFVTVTDSFGCMSTDKITLKVNPVPIVQAGLNDTICYGICVTIGGNPTASGGTPLYAYQWSPEANLDHSNIANPQACLTETSTYNVKVTDLVGCTAKDSVTIDVILPAITFTPSSPSMCIGADSITLCAGGGNTYIWNGALGTDSCLTIAPPSSTIYSVTVTGINGCTASDKVTVDVNSASASISATKSTICRDDSTTLTAKGGITYIWNTVPVQTESTITLSPAVNSAYCVTVTTNDGCTATNCTNITVNPTPHVDLVTQPPTLCNSCDGSITAIVSEGTPDYTYLWSNEQNSQIVINLCSDTYSITVTDINGCKDKNTAVVKPENDIEDLTINNSFSPNDDGINDLWIIKNIELFPDNDLIIVNRWGNEVYNVNGYKSNWDGSSLNEGTYFYILRVNMCGENKMYKGYLTILR